MGRHDVTSLILVADPNNVSSLKPEVTKIINNFSYIEGKKYSDYIPGKDKIAEYGLTALIAGGAGAAATKLGLFAKILILLKKFWIILFAPIIYLYNKLKSKLSGK